MARNTLTVQESGPDGVQISWTALNVDGHQFVWQDGCRILIKNGVTEFDLAVPITQTVQGEAVTAKTNTVAASEDYDFRIDDENPYLQAGNMIWLNYSETTDGEVAIVH